MHATDPQFAETIRASFARQGLMTTLRARLVSIEAGRVVIEMANGPHVGQQQGLVHGGAIGAIGDTAGGYAALSLMPAGSEVVTVEYKINFMRAAKGEIIRATGVVARAGRSVTVGRVEVESGPAGGPMEAVALLQATFLRV